MSSYVFYTVDVFTEQRFGGNPLAVLPHAEGLSGEQMQAITREFNLSETTFVLPPQNPGSDRRVRIFTPARELPFAGHPTLGTAHVLTACGEVVPRDGRCVLDEGIGPVTVDVETRPGGRGYLRLTLTSPAEFGPPPPPADALAEVLSLNADDVADDQPIVAASCGVPFLLVPLTGLDAMARLRADLARMERLLGDYWTSEILAWTRETVHDDATIHARMLAPLLGVAEDPATGSAAAAFAAALGAHDTRPDGTLRWRIEQGLEMGRPSFLDAEAEKKAGAVVAIRVGGAAVTVSRGEMTVAD